MVRVNVLGIVGFNPVMAFPGEQRVAVLHQGAELLAGKYPLLLLIQGQGGCEIAAVMAQAVDFRIHVFPQPVVARDLTEAGIQRADVFPLSLIHI